MKKTLIIRTAPVVRINTELAAVLVGLKVDLRPELLVWTEEPSDPNDACFYFLHNNDLREALTARDDITAASAWFEHLPIDRATRVECACCELVESSAETAGT